MPDRLDYRNRRRLLLTLLDCGSATKLYLAQKTGLSSTTISDSVNAMTKTGFLCVNGAENSAGGRRSLIYSINGSYGWVIGVHLLAECIYIVVCDACGTILNTLEIRRKEMESAIRMLYRGLDTVMGLSEQENILTVGIGIEGALDYGGQTVLKSETLGWRNVPLKEIAERRIYVPVFIDNIINGQVSLRKYLEKEKCPANFIALNENAPRKAAICLDRHICRGKNNLCGEAENFEDASARVGSCAGMLGIEKIWVARHLREDHEGWYDSFAVGGAEVEIYEADPWELAWGMALEAETKWFGTIYFGRRSPVSDG